MLFININNKYYIENNSTYQLVSIINEFPNDYVTLEEGGEQFDVLYGGNPTLYKLHYFTYYKTNQFITDIVRIKNNFYKLYSFKNDFNNALNIQYLSTPVYGMPYGTTNVELIADNLTESTNKVVIQTQLQEMNLWVNGQPSPVPSNKFLINLNQSELQPSVAEPIQLNYIINANKPKSLNRIIKTSNDDIPTYALYEDLVNCQPENSPSSILFGLALDNNYISRIYDIKGELLYDFDDESNYVNSKITKIMNPIFTNTFGYGYGYLFKYQDLSVQSEPHYFFSDDAVCLRSDDYKKNVDLILSKNHKNTIYFKLKGETQYYKIDRIDLSDITDDTERKRKKCEIQDIIDKIDDVNDNEQRELSGCTVVVYGKSENFNISETNIIRDVRKCNLINFGSSIVEFVTVEIQPTDTISASLAPPEQIAAQTESISLDDLAKSNQTNSNTVSLDVDNDFNPSSTLPDEITIEPTYRIRIQSPDPNDFQWNVGPGQYTVENYILDARTAFRWELFTGVIKYNEVIIATYQDYNVYGRFSRYIMTPVEYIIPADGITGGYDGAGNSDHVYDFHSHIHDIDELFLRTEAPFGEDWGSITWTIERKEAGAPDDSYKLIFSSSGPRGPNAQEKGIGTGYATIQLVESFSTSYS